MAKKDPKKNVNAVLSMMEEFAGGVEVSASDDALSLISNLAQQQYAAVLEVAEAEDSLKAAKEKLRRIAEEDLPEAMKAAGIKEFTTRDDLVIAVKDDVNVGISVDNKPTAYEWLVENGFGGLIKSDLEVHFDRDELEKAQELMTMIKEAGYTPDFSQSVHAQTLKAFVKERLADTTEPGDEGYIEFPKELFGVRTYQVASVKPKKSVKLKKSSK